MKTAWLEYEGRRLTLSEWARETGISFTTLAYRLKKGWAPEKILAPVERAKQRPGGGQSRAVTLRGVTKTLQEWAQETGIPYSTLWRRLYRQQQPPEVALTTPVKAGGWAKRGSE